MISTLLHMHLLCDCKELKLQSYKYSCYFIFFIFSIHIYCVPHNLKDLVGENLRVKLRFTSMSQLLWNCTKEKNLPKFQFSTFFRNYTKRISQTTHLLLANGARIHQFGHLHTCDRHPLFKFSPFLSHSKLQLSECCQLASVNDWIRRVRGNHQLGFLTIQIYTWVF